jgi:hypothetical protein
VNAVRYASLADRIIAMSVLDPEGSGCWIWLGARLKTGYGRCNVSLPGGGVIATTAHRAAWMAFRRGEHYGLDVHHTCGNRSCVNPAHLELMAHKANCATGRRKNGTNGAARGNGGRFKKPLATDYPEGSRAILSWRLA